VNIYATAQFVYHPTKPMMILSAGWAFGHNPTEVEALAVASLKLEYPESEGYTQHMAHATEISKQIIKKGLEK
jgi:hypothetical protein